MGLRGLFLAQTNEMVEVRPVLVHGVLTSLLATEKD